MQKSLMQTKGVEGAPAQEPKQVERTIVDRYVELKAEVSRIDAEIEQAVLPFQEAIREENEKAYEATKELTRKRSDTAQKLVALEKEILKGTEGQEQALVPGNKGHMVQVKRTMQRKVDAEGLFTMLDSEGLLGNYGYLFKKTVTIKDFEGAAKQPIFPERAQEFVKTGVRSAKVEVV